MDDFGPPGKPRLPSARAADRGNTIPRLPRSARREFNPQRPTEAERGAAYNSYTPEQVGQRS
jgi:hypothetical protein